MIASLVAQMVKRLPGMRETWARPLGWTDPLEKEMATHSSTLAWKIPWTEEPGRLQSMGSQRVGHDWATLFTYFDDSYSDRCEMISHCGFNLHFYNSIMISGASNVALVAKNPPANAGDVRDTGSIPGLGRSSGGGHGNPVQYSRLENPMDGGAWRATVHGVTKSQTRLKWLSPHAVISDAEYLFTCLTAISTSSLGKCLLRSSALKLMFTSLWSP